MRAALVIACCSLYCLPVFADVPVTVTEEMGEESLALRRIADFWEEGEYQIAKSQMEEFLAKCPASPYSDVLCIALGDLFVREKSFKLALDYYARVEDQSKIFLNRLQCLYHLEWHANLADECEAYLKQNQGDESLRLQATYFLAIALYQQCLNAPEASVAILAERAQPYFETLAASDLSSEVASAFAHLRCILKDFKGAAEIYLHLAAQSSSPEELMFQAALLQSKFDKDLALQTFDRLQQSPLAAQAAYNRLVLFYDQGRYAEITALRNQWVATVPTDRIGLTHLFLGQSFFAQNDYEQAAVEFAAFLDAEGPADSMRNGLLYLVDAAYKSGNLRLLEEAIARLQSFDSADSQLASALFSRSLLLKKEGRLVDAQEQLKALLTDFPSFTEKSAAQFELCHLEFTTKNWAATLIDAVNFMEAFPETDLCAFAWRYAAESALELQFIESLELLLTKPKVDAAEQSRWQFRLAKLEFDQGKIEAASKRLSTLLSSELSFPERADCELLFALCYTHHQDIENFCKWAEAALAHGSTAILVSEQHMALFNAYLNRSMLPLAAKHLLSAFKEKADIHSANLLWLAQYLFDQQDFEAAYVVFLHIRPQLQEEKDLFSLAKLHAIFGHRFECISLLEPLNSRESKLLLAETLMEQGTEMDRVERLFDEVASSDTLRDRCGATAALHSARLKIARRQFDQAAVLLKNLTLQKNLEHEPIYLEAALDYIELQKTAEKRLALLKKTKQFFEAQDDLLSKDYHAAREKLPEQNNLYLGYIEYLNAQILLLESEQQAELKAKAKEMLGHLASEAAPLLQARIKRDVAVFEQ